MSWSDGRVIHRLQTIPRASTAGSLPTRGDDCDRRRSNFLAAVTRRVHPLDVLALLSVPAVLAAAFASPEPVRRDLTLAYLDPTLLTAFTAHFVHLDAAHLATNLLVYTLVVPTAFLLCAISGRKQEFYVAFATFLLAFPVVLSVLNVALARPRVGYGFSGVNAAFFGFLPLALCWYLSSGVDVPVDTHDAPTLFFASATVVSVMAVPGSTPSLTTAVLGALITGAYLCELAPRVSSWRLDPRPASRGPGYLELGVLGVMVFTAFPLLAFPSDPVSTGFVVNIYGHFLGYALGFIASYMTFSLVGVDPDW